MGSLVQRLKARKHCNANEIERNILWWICKLRYHYVVSNIVLFALLQVHLNQQIVVSVPWLRGSVNLTANEIHTMKKNRHLLAVVLRSLVGSCVRRGTSKGGRKSVEATCC